MDFSIDAVRVTLARLLLAVVVLGVIWLLRNFVTWILSRPLQSLMSRIGVAGEEATALIRSIILIPVRYLLLAAGVNLSARVLELGDPWLDFALNISRTLVIVAIGVLAFRLVAIVIISPKRFLLFTGMTLDDALLPFVRTGFLVVTIAIVMVILLQVWGYDITGLVAGLGLGGLAFSLAAQDLLSNLFGFAAVVSDRPFVVGEYIKTPDVEGTIEHVGIRSTRVRQLNQAVVYVPNSKLAAGTVLNWSRLAKRWIDFRLRLEFSSHASEIERILRELRVMLSTHTSIDPKSIFVYLVEIAESSIQIQVRCYVMIADFTAFTQEQERILLNVLRVLERLDVPIALPSQTIYYEFPDAEDAPPRPMRSPIFGGRGARTPAPPDMPEAGARAYPSDAPSVTEDDKEG